MSVDFVTTAFWCNSGTSAQSVRWSVSGDPSGRVDVARVQLGGPTIGIGSNVSHSGSAARIYDNPPGNGTYLYLVTATGSNGVVSTGRSPAFAYTVYACVS